MSLPPAADAALAPLRAALLADAQARAAEITRAAAAQARAILDDAEREASAIRAAAVAAGEAAARAEAAERSARARRQAAERVLAARTEGWLAVREAVRDAARALRDDPRHPAILASLRAVAAAELPGATITESPDGGLVAQSGTRRLDLTLPTLALDLLESPGARP